MNFSFDSIIKSAETSTEETVKKCFQQYSRTIDGLTLDSFGHLLGALFINEQKVSYDIPVEWKTNWFRRFDLNGDQMIDWQEFQLMWTNWIAKIIWPKSALIVIDVQNDFISGSLAINKCPAGHRGEDVIPVINTLIESVSFDQVIYSQDWHPPDHISFFENKHIRKFKSDVAPNQVKPFDTVIFDGCPPLEQKLWPTHCISETWGSRLHFDLLIKDKSIKILKGIRPDVDSYSAFRDNQKLGETDLNRQLKDLNITDLYFCGLATDFCVGWSAMDAIDYGYRTVLIEDASRGVNEEAINEIKERLIANKAIVVNSSQVIHLVEATDRPPQLAFGLALREHNNNKKV